MATLKKMTRMGADVRQIARLLQAKAPEGHMLAYITPDEAEMLKSQGGSGKEHEDTGIPSFEDEGGYGFTEDTAYDIGDVRAEPAPLFSQPVAQVNAQEPVQVAQNYFNAGDNGFYGMQEKGSSFAQPYSEGQGFQANPNRLYAAREFPITTVDTSKQIDTSRASPEKKVIDTLVEKTGLSKETLARLGLAAGGSLYGAYQSKKAAEQGQSAKREQQALSEPYRAKGAELQRAAQAGELTPQSQQALQAVQAQAAQQAASRGGVGTMQSQAQVEAFRQQLLAQQYDYGLKLSGIGDNLALGAIKTGLEADRYVQNLSNSFYSNMANIAAGFPAQAQAKQRTE